jgi:hypothetical protein
MHQDQHSLLLVSLSRKHCLRVETGLLTSGRATTSLREHASLLMRPCGQIIAINIAIFITFLQYMSYIGRDQFAAPSRCDLVLALEDLCDVITTKVGRLLRAPSSVSVPMLGHQQAAM